MNENTDLKESPTASSRWLNVVALILVAAVVVAAAWRFSDRERSAPQPTPSVGQAVASLREWQPDDFTLESLDGQMVSLSDFRGRPVFLNFWGTWCQPCRREFPAFEAFMNDQPEDGAIILAINQGEDAEDVQAFMDEVGVSGVTVLLDYELDLVDDFPTPVLPTTFILDGEGFVRFRTFGEIRLFDLNKYLDDLG